MYLKVIKIKIKSNTKDTFVSLTKCVHVLFGKMRVLHNSMYLLHFNLGKGEACCIIVH